MHLPVLIFFAVETLLFEEEETALDNLLCSYCDRVLSTCLAIFHASFLAALCLNSQSLT